MALRLLALSLPYINAQADDLGAFLNEEEHAGIPLEAEDLTQDLMNTYTVRMLPAFFLLDEQGRVMATCSGWTTKGTMLDWLKFHITAATRSTVEVTGHA